MKYKVIAGIMLTLLLVSMLTVTFSIPSIAADISTAEFPDNPSAVQEADGDKPLNLTDSQESFLSEGFNRNALAKENSKPCSVDEDRWNFNRTNEWADFTEVDYDSAELVIGINNGKPNSYANILGLIGENGGDLVGNVSMGGEIRAVVGNIPLVAASSFVTEVRDAGLSRYVESNMKFQACLVPNDPYWSYQWGPCRIEADYAWNTTIGNSSVLVAVIDTGIDYDHPDLAANYVALGYDWVNNDPDPMDDEGHGTHCAGIIAAVINNSIGIAGLAQVQIMAEKGLDSGGWGTEDDLANAIIHAVDQGADILSNSWGSYGESVLIHEAVEYAYDHGVLVVAAAGNDATSMKLYPAAYDEVIAVTATDEYDNPAWFTNFGDWVELAAPGVDIYSTVWDDTYDYMSGTSMSTPHVVGVAALILSQFPSMTRDQVRLQLRFTADDLGDPGFDDYYGYGRINARKAVEQAPSNHDLLILDWETPRFVEPGALAIINTTVFNFGTSNETNITVQLLVNGSIVDSATIDFLGTATSDTVNCSWTPMVEGMYNLTSHVLPVPNETLTANNVVTAMVCVGYFKYILFDQTHGTDSIVMYNTWVTALTERGYIFDVHTSGSITSGVLVDYDAFVIPQAHYVYTSDELTAIQSFIAAGGGLLVVGDDEPYIYTELTGFAGITWSWDGCGGTSSDITSHPVTEGVTTAYFDSPMSSLYVSDPAQGLIRDACGYIMLAASETGSGKVLGIADEHSINDYYISYADNFQLAINMINWLTFRPEHDLDVTLETPPYIEPGESSLLNVTVHNRGMSNEIDVELFLFIDGTIVNNVTIPELVTGSSYKLGYLWTPVVEEMYNVTGYAVPVQNETVTENNLAWAYVYVGFPVKAFVLDSAGTYRSDVISTWEVLNTNWYVYGTTMIYIDYTTLDKDDISYNDIAATGADVLIISCASDPLMGWEFTDSEIEAITRYVKEGHGLIATAGTLYYQVPNNNKLAPLFGLNETISWHTTNTDLLHMQDPSHPLFVNVPNPYTFPQVMTASPPDGTWDLNELDGGTYVAIGHYEESAIVVRRGLVYISPWMEIIPVYYHYHLQLLYNAIIWSRYQKPQHELVVSLEAPQLLKLGKSVLLNATISNMGLSNETSVELQLLINGVVANSTTIPELWVGDSYTLGHLWTPTAEGIYNITAYALPVLGEDDISNNVKSVKVLVSALSVALFQNYNPWDYPSNEEVLDRYGVLYIVFSSSDFGRVDLSGFTKVVIASDQDQAFYNDMDTYRWWFEDYVSNGGVLEIHAADWGWHGGEWIGPLPGGLQWASYYGQYVTVVDPTHPLLTTPNTITEAELDNWNYAVHGYFSIYPADAHIIIIEDSTRMPAYLEFGYGSGSIIASSQTLEWGYNLQFSLILENSLFYMPIKYEHDLAVTLDTLTFLKPGDSSLLNATVFNRGLNNETNVELFLLINGTAVNSTTIPELLTGASYTINYLWTPTVEATYNVTAYAPPVLGENITANNVHSQYVIVSYAPKILAYVQYTDYDQEYANALRAIDSTFGSNYLLTELWDYTQLDSMLLGNDILFVPEQEYTSLPTMEMIGASWSTTLSNFMAEGGIIIVCDYSGGSHGILTGAGLMSISGVNGITGMTVYLVDPSDPLAEGVSNTFIAPDGALSFITAETNVVFNDGTYPVVIHKIIGPGHIALIGFDYYASNPDADRIIGNAVGLAIRYEHDIAVSLGAPNFLGLGESTLLNATVTNRGLNNETSAELQLLINGIMVDNVLIPELLTGASYTLSYHWAPTTGGLNYNVTAYALPVPVENLTSNNRATRMVYVSFYARVYLPPEWIGGGIPMGWHADDASWQYTLPFDFPFYGINYRTIYISSNGLITFIGPDTSYSNSIPALAGKLAIAPAWDDWETYEPHDIYISQPDSTHIVIRWEVAALYDSSIAANFEVILSSNGIIQFNYGYNNGPISATIGISNGAGDILAEDVTDLSYINTIILTPLVSPETHDVAIVNVAASATEVYEGQMVNITVVAKNEGNVTETFDVTVYYDASVIGIQTVTNLTAGANVTLTFSWDTTGVTPSLVSYTIKAVATWVPGETDTGDNTYVDGTVKVKIAGDVNGDGIVDIVDVAIAALAFGSAAEDDPETPWNETAKWNPVVDLNGDGFIDIVDLVIIGINFGERLPEEEFEQTTVYVDPQSTTVMVGDTFTVDVKIFNVTNLFGFEYKLFWDSTYVNVTSYTIHIPPGWEPPNGFLVRDEIVREQAELFYHWYCYTSLTGAPFTGDLTLATYTFTVLNPGSCALDIQDDRFVDNAAQLIPHHTVDGYVTIV